MDVHDHPISSISLGAHREPIKQQETSIPHLANGHMWVPANPIGKNGTIESLGHESLGQETQEKEYPFTATLIANLPELPDLPDLPDLPPPLNLEIGVEKSETNLEKEKPLEELHQEKAALEKEKPVDNVPQADQTQKASSSSIINRFRAISTKRFRAISAGLSGKKEVSEEVSTEEATKKRAVSVPERRSPLTLRVDMRVKDLKQQVTKSMSVGLTKQEFKNLIRRYGKVKTECGKVEGESAVKGKAALKKIKTDLKVLKQHTVSSDTVTLVKTFGKEIDDHIKQGISAFNKGLKEKDEQGNLKININKIESGSKTNIDNLKDEKYNELKQKKENITEKRIMVAKNFNDNKKILDRQRNESQISEETHKDQFNKIEESYKEQLGKFQDQEKEISDQMSKTTRAQTLSECRTEVSNLGKTVTEMAKTEEILSLTLANKLLAIEDENILKETKQTLLWQAETAFKAGNYAKANLIVLSLLKTIPEKQVDANMDEDYNKRLKSMGDTMAKALRNVSEWMTVEKGTQRRVIPSPAMLGGTLAMLKEGVDKGQALNDNTLNQVKSMISAYQAV